MNDALRLDPLVKVLGNCTPGARIDIMVELVDPQEPGYIATMDADTLEIDVICTCPGLSFDEGNERKAVWRRGEAGSAAWFTATVASGAEPGKDLPITLAFSVDGVYAGNARIRHPTSDGQETAPKP